MTARRRMAVLLAAGGLVVGSALINLVRASSALATTVAVPTGPWAVPAGVTCVTFTAQGGSGGVAGGTQDPGASGNGAVITATLPVAGVLNIVNGGVGAAGLAGGAGGSPGGGGAGSVSVSIIGGGGGGGRSSVVAGTISTFGFY